MSGTAGGCAVELELNALEQDFEYELHEPGERSGAALELLLDDLSAAAAPVERPWEWAEALQPALGHGIDALVQRLGHPDPRIGRIAAHVLAYARVDVAALVPRLLECLRGSEDEVVRAGLLLVLSRATDGSPAAADAAGRVLREHLSPSTPPGLRLTAALALERGGAYDEAVAAAFVSGVRDGGGAVLEQLPCGEFRSVDWLVSYAFEGRRGWFGRRIDPVPERERARAAYIGRLITEAPNWLAIGVAGGLLYDRSTVGELAVPLGRLLHHADPALRAEALSALARHYPPPEAVREDLALALSDPAIGWKACVTLARMGDVRALPRVLKALPERRREVYIALRRLGAYSATLRPAIDARLAAPADECEAAALAEVLHDWDHPEEVPEDGWWLPY